MNILIALKTGIVRAFGSWKGILTVWLLTLIPAAMIALPARGAVNSGLGYSTISERLTDGLDIEVFADMEGFGRIVSFLGNGILVFLLLYFIMNAFISGGLFESARGSASFSSFLKASAARFIPFLVVLAIIYLIITVLFLVIFVVPVSIMITEAADEAQIIRTGIVCFSIFLVFLTIMITVADYARAWQVTRSGIRSLRAIGFGFSQTFRTFFSSWFMIIIILAIQAFFLVIVLKVLPPMKPSTGGGIFLFFILSQAVFIIKILLRVFRYGCITSMMEQTPGNNTLT